MTAEAERFIGVAWRRLDDPAFGLRAGCVLRPERYGISGLTAMASSTFGAALQRKACYRLEFGAKAALERMDDGDVTARVRAGMERMLQGDEPTLEAVVEDLNSFYRSFVAGREPRRSLSAGR